MSWSRDLSGSFLIKDKEVADILDAVNATSLEGGRWRPQSWGWSAECDVIRERETSDLVFSGSSFSRNSDLPDRFALEAVRRGYTCDLGAVH